MLYSIDYDNINNVFNITDDVHDGILAIVPFQAETDANFYVDDNFSVVEASESTFTLIYKSSDYTTVSDFKFDFSGIFNTLSSGMPFDFGIWDNSNSFEIFWFAVDINGNFNNLITDYFNIDTATYVATGLTYVDSIVPVTTCDLSEVYLRFDSLMSLVVSLSSSVGYLATKTDIEGLVHYDVSNITLPSLNGNGTEFKDGSSVTVFGRETVYTVERSYMSLYSDNAYTVHYDLVSADGYKCSVPEALLTKQVVAV